VTNTGFVRPIDRDKICNLKKGCVIPLMWEPWEYRKEDLDIEACLSKGVKVYGSNESDIRLRTMEYIGYIVLSLLLENKRSPFSSNVLVLGNDDFAIPTKKVLLKNGYKYKHVSNYNSRISEVEDFDVIVIIEHEKKELLIGENGYIDASHLRNGMCIIHICGNVNFEAVQCQTVPQSPANFGYMSYTTDYVDSKAVIDLHTAGLKVAEGMLQANSLNLHGEDYKNFMEKEYPALAFTNPRYW